jgi:GntR family transcriptional regulator
MFNDWNDREPIYLQIHDRVIGMILDGVLQEGTAIPSVRTVAAEAQINPLTVSKGYQQLVDEGIVEKRRGLGMFVADGARERLQEVERRRFLEQEWPGIAERIRRLGLDLETLIGAMGEQDQ